MNSEIDKEKVKYGLSVFLFSGLGSYFGQPLIHGNDEAINIIVTVFSILAGFLVAIMAIIGDPASLPSGGWRIARLGSDIIYTRLVRQKWLFILYLGALVTIFISTLIKDQIPFSVEKWIERIYLLISINAILLSFKLPSALLQLHQERIEHEIKSRREAEGIKED